MSLLGQGTLGNISQPLPLVIPYLGSVGSSAYHRPGPVRVTARYKSIDLLSSI